MMAHSCPTTLSVFVERESEAREGFGAITEHTVPRSPLPPSHGLCQAFRFEVHQRKIALPPLMIERQPREEWEWRSVLRKMNFNCLFPGLMMFSV